MGGKIDSWNWVVVWVWSFKPRNDFVLGSSPLPSRESIPRRNWFSQGIKSEESMPGVLKSLKIRAHVKRIKQRYRTNCEGVGSPNLDDWRKGLALCLLCTQYLQSSIAATCKFFKHIFHPSSALLDNFLCVVYSTWIVHKSSQIVKFNSKFSKFSLMHVRTVV